jgi:hypothetical protein
VRTVGAGVGTCLAWPNMSEQSERITGTADSALRSSDEGIPPPPKAVG